jgi:predicted O-methyltransferase YrrM
LPPIAISSDEGRLLQVLLTAINATRPRGRALGSYSAICMARAAAWRAVVVDRNRRKARRVRPKYVERAAWRAHRIRVGRALDVLPSLDGERFDAVFLDADKSLPTASSGRCVSCGPVV